MKPEEINTDRKSGASAKAGHEPEDDQLCCVSSESACKIPCCAPFSFHSWRRDQVNVNAPRYHMFETRRTPERP